MPVKGVKVQILSSAPPSFAKASEGLRPERNLDRRRSVLRSFSEVGLPGKGRVAQLIERPAYIRKAAGLSPASTTSSLILKAC